MKQIVTTIVILSSIVLNAQRTDARLDSLISETIAAHEIPSMVVGYITNDSCYFGIGGKTQINGGRDAQLKDMYHLGSNTKAITSLIAMHMVEGGQISMNTTFLDVFPQLKRKIKKTYSAITLGDLLSHNAGVQPYTNPAEFVKLPELVGTPKERRKAFAKFVLNEEPIEGWGYSNAGYAIASLMLETVAETSFEEMIAESMKELNYNYTIGFPNQTDKNAPWGHYGPGSVQQALSPDFPYGLEDYMLAAGDVSMNILDYSDLIQMHLNGLNGEEGYVNSANFKEMHFGKEKYAYGWGNREVNGTKVSAHDGSGGTFFCHTQVVPDKNFAIVIIMNAANQEQVEGLYGLEAEILKGLN